MKANGKCTFDRAQYLAGQPVRITLCCTPESVKVRLFCMEKEILCTCEREQNELILTGLPEGNYGILITGSEVSWEGAFDVVCTRRAATRYGFLSDFSADDDSPDAVCWMRDLHLNAVQFYDWMYRHDHLVSPTEDYTDPLGRSMRLSVVRDKALACQSFGIRPFAYGAVYAATKDTLNRHPDWALYTMDGVPMLFANWLCYMNPSDGCGWTEYLLRQYCQAVAFGFQGIHMDTYGFPKRVWDVERNPVEMSQIFPELIEKAAQAVKAEDPESGVIFNAVNNWPMEAVAKTSQDAIYIEVWPPNDTYRDLYTLIKEARLCSDKAVVLAAYMKPFGQPDMDAAEAALRLCWAAVSASGGTQLVLGEKGSVLKDSYYVNYAKLREEFLPCVQRYCDFLVRYAPLMYGDPGVDVSRTASGGINEDICFSGSCQFSPDGRADTVWTLIRESEKRLTVHMINLLGNDENWNVPKRPPAPKENITITFRLDRPVSGIYTASPDRDSLAAQPLPVSCRCTNQGRIYEVMLPRLEYWSVVWVESEE